jgi:hypothetical protein
VKPELTVGESLTTALGRGSRAWRLWLCVWGCEAALALAASAPALALFSRALARSPRGRLVLERLDTGALVDLATGALRNGGPMLAAALAGSVLVYLAVSALLAGGALASFAPGGRAEIAFVLERGARSFGRMLRVLAAAGVGYALAVALVAGAHAAVRGAEHRLLDERAAVALQAGELLFAVFAFTFAGAVADFARARIAVAGERSPLRAYLHAVRTVLRQPALCWGTCFGATVAGTLAAALFAWLRSAVMVEGASTALASFLFGELALLGRAWGRGVGWAGVAGVALALEPAQAPPDAAGPPQREETAEAPRSAAL